MSMHGENEGSFQRINKSAQQTSMHERDSDDGEGSSRKKCIIIVSMVCVLAAAITALVLVLIFGHSGDDSIPKGYNGYTLQNDPVDGKWFYSALLKRTKDVKLPVETNTTNPEFQDLSMRVSMTNDMTFRLKINPVNMPTEENGLKEPTDSVRWEVPDDLLGNTKDDYGMRLIWGGFEGSKKGDTAGITTKFLTTKDRNLVFSERYIEQGFLLNSRNLYGFGERQGQFGLIPGEYSSWADGRDNHFDNATVGGQSYGDHPFVLAKLKDNTFAGIFFKNSNAKTLEIKYVGKGKSILNFKAAGGVLDFYTFYAEEAEDVIKAYQQVVGTPYLPPFWALGFQQSSWTYRMWQDIENVMSGYEKAEMPLEVIWLDIEYLLGYRNFFVNETAFPKLSDKVKELHKKGYKVVPIVDAGLEVGDYEIFNQFHLLNLFIKSNKTGDDLIAKVWPGQAAFPDFFHPKTEEQWHIALNKLYKDTLMDGIWLDMNEVTTFCDGECPANTALSYSEDGYELPYKFIGDRNLTSMGISVDAKHYAATPEAVDLNVEFNMHSLYAISQAKATQQYWFKGSTLQGRRPFVLSRSSFAGAGKYTSHWLGDNWSKWEYMTYSVAGIMDMNMFGMPLVGADVCGFHNNFTQDMCGRWMQLSAFYPFARNHYNLTDGHDHDLAPQEPYVLEEPYKSAARNSIYQRYSFLRYFYTRLFEISKNGGGTLVRPLFFEFPEDKKTMDNYERDFMVGSALKVTPVLTKEQSDSQKVTTYIPANSRFVSLQDFTKEMVGGSSGTEATLDAGWNYTNVQMRDGNIIPYQNASALYMPKTSDLISNLGISLIVFPDKAGKAHGTLYIDENGDDQSDYELGYYQYYKIDYADRTLKFSTLDGTGSKGKQDSGNQILSGVIVIAPQNLTEEERKDLTGCAYDKNLIPTPIDVQFVQGKNYLILNSTQNQKLLFNNLHSLQFSSNKSDSSFCSPKYTVKSINTVYANDGSNNAVKKVIQIQSGTSSALPDLEATFSLVKDSLLRVQIKDPTDETAFKAPDETFGYDPSKSDATIDLDAILKLPVEGEGFYYEVHSFLDPTVVLYSTRGEPFVYSKYYKKTTAQINSNGYIFGLGERVGDFFLDPGVYTLWARDIPSPVENGKPPGKNVYGVHPIYFSKLSKGTEFFAVFDHNAGAQDYVIEKVDKNYKMTQIKTSGVTDQFIFLNNDIKEVVAEFIQLMGKPTMVPEWSLGWHQCRYGYNNTADVNAVVEGYMSNKIPLDVMWTDIDYMHMYEDFTVSDTDFAGLAGNITKWNETYGIRYIPILDAGIAYDTSSGSSYSRGKSQKVFINDPNDKNKPFIGKVWPGEAVYVDWHAAKAEDFWIDEMNKLHDKVPFSGMWIDMNEASNFCNGYCYRSQKVEDSIQDKLFYTPGARQLNDKSVSIDAVHVDGHTEYEMHSLYGFYMSKATSNYFAKRKERPFVITRSTYAGVGKYVSHWLGDNFASYDMMKYSVGGIYLFNMFGVPVTGADICGFIGDTNPNLCARWYALGAFYPFSRNHNNKVEISQEPYVSMFKDQTMPDLGTLTYMDFIRETTLKRYAVHRYQYSNLHRSSTNGTVYFKPLFFNYPDESDAYKRVEHNILLGDSLKLSPVLEDTKGVVNFWFPGKNDRWCPLWPKKYTACIPGQSSQGQQMLLNEVWIHLKSGSIIPLQISSLTNVPDNINIDKLRDLPIELALVVDKNYQANGFVIYDDGLSTNLDEYTEFYFKATGANPYLSSGYLDMTVTTVVDNYSLKTEMNQKLGTIIVYDTSKIGFSASTKAVIKTKAGSTITATTAYDSKTYIIRFTIASGQEVDLRDIASIHMGK